MKIKREKTNRGWKVTLEYRGTVYQSEKKTMAEAMREAFSLVELN
jgi:hypothetical protein